MTFIASPLPPNYNYFADLLAAQCYEVGHCGHHWSCNWPGGFHYLHYDEKPLETQVHSVQVWYVVVMLFIYMAAEGAINVVDTPTGH